MFNNRSQMTSKYGKNQKKKVAYDVQPSDVLATLYFNIATVAMLRINTSRRLEYQMKPDHNWG